VAAALELFLFRSCQVTDRVLGRSSLFQWTRRSRSRTWAARVQARLLHHFTDRHARLTNPRCEDIWETHGSAGRRSRFHHHHRVPRHAQVVVLEFLPARSDAMCRKRRWASLGDPPPQNELAIAVRVSLRRTCQRPGQSRAFADDDDAKDAVWLTLPANLAIQSRTAACPQVHLLLSSSRVSSAHSRGWWPMAARAPDRVWYPIAVNVRQPDGPVFDRQVGWACMFRSLSPRTKRQTMS
jgi:hypothetical protein